jgi:Predicted site-specific integrase-resolvase
MSIYKPKDFSKLIHTSVKTLQRWDREGTFKAHRTSTGRHYYTHDQYLEYLGVKHTGTSGKMIAYSRVSSHGQKGDMARQEAALRDYCQNHQLVVSDWISDIDSGLNYRRKGLERILQAIEVGQVSTLVIAHRDRLVRFGFEWFADFCERHGTRLIVVNGDSLSPEQELVQDLLSIVHVFSSRLYGLRSYKKVLKDVCLARAQNSDKESN